MFNMEQKIWKHVFVTSSSEKFTFYTKAVKNDDNLVTTLFIRGPGGLFRKLVFPDRSDFWVVELFLGMAEDDNYYMFYAANIVKEYDGEMAFLMMKVVDCVDAGYALLGDYLADVKHDFQGAFDAYSESDSIYSTMKLGCLYAEGKGCKKNPDTAKELFESILSVYPDAEKYLDEYGLR